MSAADGMRALKHAEALQCALSAAAKACASYRIGATRIGDDALLSASEMITVAFGAGSDGAAALALVLDAVESVGDAAKFEAIVTGLTPGGAR
jgi:hypothetical protein